MGLRRKKPYLGRYPPNPLEPGAPLNEREAAVMRLMCDGMHNKGIADQLGISEEAVKWRSKNAMKKLNATSRIQAACRFAVEEYAARRTP